MMPNICVYEDARTSQLLPLTYMRPAYDLLIGTSRLFDKIAHRFPDAHISVHCRDYLKPIVEHSYAGRLVNHINTGARTLFINGRVLMTDTLAAELRALEPEHNHLLLKNGQIVAMCLDHDLVGVVAMQLEQMCDAPTLIGQLRAKCVAKECHDAILFDYPWDFMAQLHEAIHTDFDAHGEPGIIKGELGAYVSILNENNVTISQDTHIEDFVLINATNGPVIIESGCVIQAHSRLEGPLYIGKNTHILGGKVSASSIGPSCKIGGELSHSIILGYSNKAHHGYIGHSYIGQWVNLGAMTTNSNLKNTYSPVTVSGPFHPTPIETNQQFFGSVIGDHVKTGIGTLLNTGAIVGYASSLLGPPIHHGYIPPFSWGQAGNYDTHNLTKFLQTAQRMMARRHIVLRDPEKKVISLLANA